MRPIQTYQNGILMTRFSRMSCKLSLPLFGLCLLLTACGGAGTTTTSSTSSSKPGGFAGIDGTGTELPGDVTKVTSIGAISNNADDFKVNGTIYDISQSAIMVDGTLSDIAKLNNGQVVSVKSSQESTSASTRLAESIEAVSLARWM